MEAGRKIASCLSGETFGFWAARVECNTVTKVSTHDWTHPLPVSCSETGIAEHNPAIRRSHDTVRVLLLHAAGLEAAPCLVPLQVRSVRGEHLDVPRAHHLLVLC